MDSGGTGGSRSIPVGAAMVAIAFLFLRPADVAPMSPMATAHATAIGEIRTIQLPDGSSMTLDTDSRVEVTFTDKLRKHLGKKGFDPLMGARPMQRLIQDTIRRALADELLFGRLVDGGRLTVDLDDKDESKTEVLLDIQPLPKKEGKAKPE